jgi:hypothetical protein
MLPIMKDLVPIKNKDNPIETQEGYSLIPQTLGSTVPSND